MPCEREVTPDERGGTGGVQTGQGEWYFNREEVIVDRGLRGRESRDKHACGGFPLLENDYGRLFASEQNGGNRHVQEDEVRTGCVNEPWGNYVDRLISAREFKSRAHFREYQSSGYHRS